MCEHRKLFFSRKLREESKAMCEELAATLTAMGWTARLTQEVDGLYFVEAGTDHKPDLTMPEE